MLYHIHPHTHCRVKDLICNVCAYTIGQVYKSALYSAVIRNSEIFRFRTVLEIVRPFYFAKNVKKSVRKLPFFGKVPELKYSRSLKMVTKLHNRSKQSHFPAQIHHVLLCLLSKIGQSSIIQRLSIDKERYSLVSSH